MDLYECERRAKEEGFETATFDLNTPGGVKKCRWLDAYFGLFEIVGLKGCLSTAAVMREYPYVTCSNFDATGTTPAYDDLA